jgi:class 3 adenylate cyclase
MSSLPQGTVTFVFTDIEGSTALLKALGERYSDVLSRHRAIVRETFAAADGIEIDTQGDAFFFVFPRARDAVAAAVEVQREHAADGWPEGGRPRVRVGLHTGEPAVHEEGYLGLDVVRAARICTVGNGGQVLLSETTRALVGSSLPDGVSIFPLGERHLRGLDEPERVYELAIEDFEAEAPEQTAVSEAKEQPIERDIEKRFEDLGERFAASIQERLYGSLEKKLLGEAGAPPSSTDAEDVEDLAARSASLGKTIGDLVQEALRSRGPSRRDDD